MYTTSDHIITTSNCRRKANFIHKNKCIFLFFIFGLIVMYQSLSHGIHSKGSMPLILVNNLSCSDAFQTYCKLVDVKRYLDSADVEDRDLRAGLISRSMSNSTDQVPINSTNTILKQERSDVDRKREIYDDHYTKWCRQRLLGCICPPGQSFDRMVGDCITIAAPFTSCSRNQECQLFDPLSFCDYTSTSRHETPFCNCVPSAALNITINRCICKEKGWRDVQGTSSKPCNSHHDTSSSTLAYSARTNQLLLPIKILMVIVTSILILVVIFCLGSTFYQKLKENMREAASSDPPPSPNNRLRSQNGLTSPDAGSSGSRSPDCHDIHVTNNNVHYMLHGNADDEVQDPRASRVTRGQSVQTEMIPGEQYLYQRYQEDPPPSYDEAMKHGRKANNSPVAVTRGAECTVEVPE